MISRIEEVAAGIYRLQAQIRGQDTAYTSYFIRDTVNVLIEPGPAVLIPDIQTARKYLGLASLDYIIPTHCTGFQAITAFAREMPEQFILSTVGTRFSFGA